MDEANVNAGSARDGWAASGMVSGAVAGVVFIAFEVAAAGILGQDFLGPPRMIGAILLGEGALEESVAVPALRLIVLVGLMLHLLLAAVYGGAFGEIARIVRPLGGNRVLLVGAATGFGFLLWIVNFYVIAPLAFPWFGMAEPLVQFIAHTFFYGTALGLVLMGLSKKSGDL